MYNISLPKFSFPSLRFDKVSKLLRQKENKIKIVSEE